MSEIDDKLVKIRTWLTGHNLEALYLQRVSSFAWATCGAASYVNLASSEGAASLLITQDEQILFTNNIEAPRLEKEEKLVAQGWKFKVTPWYSGQVLPDPYLRGMQVGADCSIMGAQDVSSGLARLRANLTPQEGQRFRDLGKRCAQSMEAAMHAIHPGQTEYEIAGRLAGEVEARGVQVTVNLIATDQRIFTFRHPVPTNKKLDRYAMLILCGRLGGLVCSITRLIHFGPLPPEIRQKSKAVADIDAAMIIATRPGRTLGDIFNVAVEAYAHSGFPEEWRSHHQGGPAGYEPREYFAYPGSSDQVALGQAYAWNPSISGSKSEDTILVAETGNEILTDMPGWPKIECDGIERPDILIM